MRRIIAIIGGIGSGKSTVANIVRDNGYRVISADDVNKRLLCDKEYLGILKINFNEAFSGDNLDKHILSSIIFNDENKRKLLNSIAHIRIKAMIEDEINSIDDDVVFVEVPLIIESGMAKMFTDILLVRAGKSLRLDRVVARDNYNMEEVEKRINSQVTEECLEKIATTIIDNNGDIESLRQKVNAFLAELNTN